MTVRRNKGRERERERERERGGESILVELVNGTTIILNCNAFV